MILQPIVDIAEICVQKNVRHFILSPGSRSAHLTLALARHPAIKTLVLPDERSAAFTALGMAQHFLQEKYLQPSEKLSLVGILCTSGSAAYNYAPAIAEAFYQQIPMIVFTADRPSEWLNQRDGQTIAQFEIYGKHVKGSWQLPQDYQHKDAVWQQHRSVNEAINLATTPPFGPVHLNVPIREPFYPTAEERMTFNPTIKIIQKPSIQNILSSDIWNEILDIWENTEKILLVGGQHFHSPTLLKALRLLQEDFGTTIVGDVISNLHSLPKAIRLHDIFLPKENEHLQPELLITFGKSIIAKSLKTFLRKYPPQIHWHIEETDLAPDTFQTLTHHFSVSPEYFFEKLFSDLDFIRLLEGEEEEQEFSQKWANAEQRAKKYWNQKKSIFFHELQAVQIILEHLPQESKLHLANSMAVRYANYVGLSENMQVKVFANRGTSGIDGSNSTAVGDALLEKEKIITLITGDIAFFYDRNAFWNNELPKNLRIILLNNHAGGIFRLIEGPAKQPELKDFFETEQPLDAQGTAQEFGFEYHSLNTTEELEKFLPTFFEPSTQPKILEIPFESEHNAQAFRDFIRNF